MAATVETSIQMYERFVDKAALLVFVLNQDGTIIKANEFAKQQIGNGIENKPFDSIILDFYKTFELPDLTDSDNSDLDQTYSLNIKRTTGLPQTFQFRFDYDGTNMYAIGELDYDELESVRMEILSLNEELNNLTRELHKKNAQLELLNQEKNQFLGMAAHDLRKPIGLVITYSDFLIDEAADVLDPEHQGFLNTIQKSCIFMKRLVDDFLDVSAIEAGKFDLDLQPERLQTVLDQSLRLNTLQATKKNIDLKVDQFQDLPRIKMDIAKIEQVITNLISNAIEHSRPGTRVLVEITKKEGADIDMILFVVKDQGPGIPQAELSRLFEPYQKTSVKKTGGEKSIGLGMLITRKIIEAHQGEIWIESQVGVGTQVFFTLPVHRRAQ